MKSMKSFKSLVVSALLGTLAFLPFSHPGFSYDIPKNGKSHNFSDNVDVLSKVSKGVSEISEVAKKAVVFVSVSKTIKGTPYGEINPFDFFFGPGHGMVPREMPERKQKGLGSGFIIDLDKGYVITNNHVIEEADEIYLKLANGKSYAGKVLGRDQNTDVAVVQISDKNFVKKDLEQLTLGDSDQLAMGEFVIALGAPFGLEESLSFGVVSAAGRGNLDITKLGNFIQTDAAINPGNSGGPLLNTRGDVVGMNSAIYSRTGSSAGIGFAVPSNLVRQIATQLINKGSVARGYIGVTLSQELDQDIAHGLDLPEGIEGALISGVQEGGPAAKAGLEPGDVVTTINDKVVKNSQELTNTIGLMAPNTKVAMEYFHAGKKRKTNVTLQEYPSEEKLTQMRKEENKTFGLVLEALPSKNTEALRSRYRFVSNQGLLVREVTPNSPADAAGIEPGDVLLKANQLILKSPGDFEKVGGKAEKLLIKVERRGTILFASIRK